MFLIFLPNGWIRKLLKLPDYPRFFKNKFIYLLIFGCVGSSLLCVGFL